MGPGLQARGNHKAAVATGNMLLLHPFFRNVPEEIQIAHFGGKLRGKGFRIKKGNIRNATVRLEETLPQAFDVVTQRRNRPHAGYDDPPTHAPPSYLETTIAADNLRAFPSGDIGLTSSTAFSTASDLGDIQVCAKHAGHCQTDGGAWTVIAVPKSASLRIWVSRENPELSGFFMGKIFARSSADDRLKKPLKFFSEFGNLDASHI